MNLADPNERQLLFHNRKWRPYYIFSLIVFMSFPWVAHHQGEFIGILVGGMGFIGLATLNYLNYHYPPPCLSCRSPFRIVKASSYWEFRCTGCEVTYRKRRLLVRTSG